MITASGTFTLIALAVLLEQWLIRSQEATVLLIVSIFGLYQFRREQNWKRKEFAFKTIKSIRSLEAYGDMVRFLAWDNYVGQSFGDNKVTHADMARVLEQDSNDSSDDEKKFLYATDEFLTELDMFLFFVRRRLMRWEDVRQHMDYIVSLFSVNSTNCFPARQRWGFMTYGKKLSLLFEQIRPIQRKSRLRDSVERNVLASALICYCVKWEYDNVLWAVANHG